MLKNLTFSLLYLHHQAMFSTFSIGHDDFLCPFYNKAIEAQLAYDKIHPFKLRIPFAVNSTGLAFLCYSCHGPGFCTFVMAKKRYSKSLVQLLLLATDISLRLHG